MPQLNRAPDERLRAQREEQARRLAEQRSAFAELGPNYVKNPDTTYEDLVPVNRATKVASEEGRLAGLAEFLRSGVQMRGGMGPIELPLQKYLRIARGIAKNPSDVEDIAQTGAAAAVKRIGGKGATGPEAERVARGAMKNWRPADTQAIGARREDVRAIEKMTAKLGPVGHDKLAAALQEEYPKSGWSVKRVQDVLANRRQPEVRLDKLTKTERGVLEGRELKDVEANPEQIASIRERVSQLSPAAKRDAMALMSGEKDASELHPQTLARIRAAMSEFRQGERDVTPPGGGTIVSRQGQPVNIPPKAETPIKDAEALIVEDAPKVAQRSRGFQSKPIPTKLTPKPREISGGAVGPEDAPVEFPVNQFRPELQRQPGLMYGQEGPSGFNQLLQRQAEGGRLASGRPVNELPKRIMESEQLMATTGGGNRLGAQPIAGSQNPVSDAFQWDKLRGILKNLGYFQGKN